MKDEKKVGRPPRPSVLSGKTGTASARHIYLHDDEWQALKDLADREGRGAGAQIAHMVSKAKSS